MISGKLPPLELMARARFAACPHLVYINSVETKVRWEELTPGAQRSEIAGMRAALLAIREPTAGMKGAMERELEGQLGRGHNTDGLAGWQAMVDEVLK